jgi:hypothetical protein
VETGLFVGSTDIVHVGTRAAVEKMERKRK